MHRMVVPSGAKIHIAETKEYKELKTQALEAEAEQAAQEAREQQQQERMMARVMEIRRDVSRVKFADVNCGMWMAPTFNVVSSRMHFGSLLGVSAGCHRVFTSFDNGNCPEDLTRSPLH